MTPRYQRMDLDWGDQPYRCMDCGAVVKGTTGAWPVEVPG